MPFPPFCNQISKALALTLPHVSEDGRNFALVLNAAEIAITLQQTPALVRLWARILAAYAITGWPPQIPGLKVGGFERQVTRIQILRAMELFAVAHEYGHHMLKHGRGTGSDNTGSYGQEHEADYFARAVSLAIGTRSEPPNYYASSGAGAVIMLGALELVRRTKAVLLTSSDALAPSFSHPLMSERISHITGADESAPRDYQAVFVEMRSNFAGILDAVWAEVKPLIERLHDEGTRPDAQAVDAGGWLPLVR